MGWKGGRGGVDSSGRVLLLTSSVLTVKQSAALINEGTAYYFI